MIITQRWEKCNDCEFEQPVTPGQHHSHKGPKDGPKHNVTVRWVDIRPGEQ